MILPRILPDELLVGYRGRIAAFNGLRSPKQVALALRDPDLTRTGTTHQNLAFIDAAAVLNGLTSEVLLHRHTCLALSRGIYETRQRDHTSELNLSRFRTLAMFSHDKRLRACPKCIEQDVQTRCFAHWRRSHQVPGQFDCLVHGCPLWSVEEPDLTPAGPDDVEQSSSLFDAATHGRLTENSYVKRALAFLDAINVQNLIIRRRSCSQALQGALAGAGYRESSPSQISRDIDEAFTLDWLRFAMPRAVLVPGRTHGFVPNSMHGGVSRAPCVGVAVIASLLFRTADAALEQMGATPC